jgi:restriction system protein
MKSVFISYAHSNSAVAKQLSMLLNREHVFTVGPEQLGVGPSCNAHVFSLIRRSSLFVALMDDPSPNVMFELGYALGASKQVLLMASPETPIPFDIGSLPVARYDNYDIRSAYEVADRFLSMLIERPSVALSSGSGRQRLHYLLDNPDRLEEISPQEFESIVYEFFMELGFQMEGSTSSNEGGYDMRIRDIENGVDTIVEVKKYTRNGKIGVSSVHELIGRTVVSKAASAILIATGDFSASARSMAGKSPCPIKLLNLQQLLAISRESFAIEHRQHAAYSKV